MIGTGIFCVYGVSHQRAQGKAQAEWDEYREKNKRYDFTAEEAEKWLREATLRLYAVCTPEQISPWYATPAVCREWIRLAGETAKVPAIMMKIRVEGPDGKMQSKIVPYVQTAAST